VCCHAGCLCLCVCVCAVAGWDSDRRLGVLCIMSQRVPAPVGRFFGQGAGGRSPNAGGVGGRLEGRQAAVVGVMTDGMSASGGYVGELQLAAKRLGFVRICLQWLLPLLLLLLPVFKLSCFADPTSHCRKWCGSRQRCGSALC